MKYKTNEKGTPNLVFLDPKIIQDTTWEQASAFLGQQSFVLTWGIKGVIQQTYNSIKNYIDEKTPNFNIRTTILCNNNILDQQIINSSSMLMSLSEMENKATIITEEGETSTEEGEISTEEEEIELPELSTVDTKNDINAIRFSQNFSTKINTENIDLNTIISIIVSLEDQIYAEVIELEGTNYYINPYLVTWTASLRPTLSLGKDQVLINQPLNCKVLEGWYSSDSYGVNLNNNDIIKVNGIMFNEDEINNSGEGIQFYHPTTQNSLIPFDILYGQRGSLYFCSNPEVHANLPFSQRQRLCYGPGDHIDIESTLPLSGYITSSRKTIQFLIPLTTPILNYNSVTVTGCIQIRGNKGYLSHNLRNKTSSTVGYQDISARMEIGANNADKKEYPSTTTGTKISDGKTKRTGKFYTNTIPSSDVTAWVTPIGVMVNLRLDDKFNNVDNNTPIVVSPLNYITASTKENLEDTTDTAYSIAPTQVGIRIDIY